MVFRCAPCFRVVCQSPVLGVGIAIVGAAVEVAVAVVFAGAFAVPRIAFAVVCLVRCSVRANLCCGFTAVVVTKEGWPRIGFSEDSIKKAPIAG